VKLLVQPGVLLVIVALMVVLRDPHGLSDCYSGR